MPCITSILDWLDTVEQSPTSPTFADNPFSTKKAVAMHLQTGENLFPREPALPETSSRLPHGAPSCVKTRLRNAYGSANIYHDLLSRTEHTRLIPSLDFADSDDDGQNAMGPENEDARHCDHSLAAHRPHHSLNKGHLTVRSEDQEYDDLTPLNSTAMDPRKGGKRAQGMTENSPISPVEYQLTPEHLTIRNKSRLRYDSGEEGSRNPFILSKADQELRSTINAEIADAEDGPLKRSPGQSRLDRMRQLGIVAVEDCDRPRTSSTVANSNRLGHPSPRLGRQQRPEIESDDSSEVSIGESRWNRMRELGMVFSKDALKSPLSKLGEARRKDKKPWHVEEKSYVSKLVRKAKFDFGSRLEEATCTRPGHQVDATASRPNGPFGFQKPTLRPACADLPPGQLLHGNPFDLNTDDGVESIIFPYGPGDEPKPVLHGGAERNVTIHSSPQLPTPLIAQVEGTFGHKGDVQIPIFPHRHSSTRCRSLSCPIKGKHEKGPYLHEGKLRTREGNIFGASNPPPEIYAAYDRIKVGIPKAEASGKDYKVISRFAKHHFAYSKEWSVRQGDAEVEEL